MPPRPRTGIQPRTAIQRAHNLVSQDSATIKQVWDELCQEYLDAFRSQSTHETFPCWILDNIPYAAIQQMIDVVYDKGARKIEPYAPNLLKRFGVPQWQFVLFFGRLPQTKVRLLTRIAKRQDITFDSLYAELREVRSRYERLPNGPFDFTTSDFKSCVRDSDPEDEHENISDDAHQNADEIGNNTIIVTSNPDDNEIGSEYDDEDAFYNTSNSPINNNLSQESSSYITDVPDTYDASTNHAISSESVENSTADTPNLRSCATDDTSSPLLVQQLNQGQRGDAIRPEALGNYTLAHTQEQTGTNDSTDQSRVDLYNDFSNTANSIRQKYEELLQKHEELGREDIAIRREEEAVGRKRQEYRAKRVRCDTDMGGFVKKVRSIFGQDREGLC